MGDTTERATLTEIGVTHAHHKVHNGNAFVVCDVEDLANAASKDYLITTPNSNVSAHFVLILQSESEASYEIFENPTIDSAEIIADTISFADTGPDTILDSGDGFVAAGFTATPIYVAGSASNDGNYTIDGGGVAVGELTLVAGDALAVEAAGETVTITEGVLMAPINRNRNSSKVATVTVVNTPGVSATGTSICKEHWGSGLAGGAAGQNRGVSEIILKQNEQYLIRVTNQTAAANQISSLITWYEHVVIGVGGNRA